MAVGLPARSAGAEPLRLGVFQVDATPPVGSALCNGLVKPVAQIVTPLTARGIVLSGAGKPIVLCVFDWVGIANESHDACREALARAVGTSVDRVTVHVLHQHDAPGSDFATERLLEKHGLGGLYSNAEFDRTVFARLAESAGTSLAKARPVTQVGTGVGLVEKVASNRNILGPAGKVVMQRNSSSRNPAAQAAPEGTVDAKVRTITFWDGDRALAVLSYYATHPQSYYGQGAVNWDFVGMAREQREQALPGVAHIHFNGAGGNVAAGKYNDGSPAMRPILAGRLAAGMQQAWESQRRAPVTAADVRWHLEPVALPVRDTLREQELAARLADPKQPQAQRIRAARDLAFVQRMSAGHRMPITCLQLGSARVLHLPGELFVEYQLSAQRIRPDDFVAMAAYGDLGPGYVGTETAYAQGGYETGIVSRVAPQVESVLFGAVQALLQH
ncbi:MAG: hypothetical protein EXS37_08395 [Opitutus sp.]|nr:hypothetical protein [Opitutus sp.]